MANLARSLLHVEGGFKQILSVTQTPESLFSFQAVMPVPPLSEEKAYEWRIHHWGTQAEANIYTEKPDDIFMETRWTPPIGVIDTLAGLFPGLRLRLDWCTEDPLDPDFECQQIFYGNGLRKKLQNFTISSREGQKIFENLWGQLSSEERSAIQTYKLV